MTIKDNNLFDIETEMFVIGSVLIDNYRIDSVIELISADMFYEPRNRRIWEYITEYWSNNKSISIESIRILIQRDDVFKKSSDSIADYITVLNKQTFLFFEDVTHYAKIIRDYHTLRSIERICSQGLIWVKGGVDRKEIDDIIPAIEENLYKMSNWSSSGMSVAELLDKVYEDINRIRDNPETISGIKTGLNDVDDFMGGGLSNSDLVILAARPSMGKTSLALSMAFNMAKCHKPVLFFSMEMSAEQIMYRLISMHSDIPMANLRSGTKLDNARMESLQQSISFIKSATLYVEDTPSLDISKIRIIARRMKKKHNISCIFIDYLQLAGCAAYSRESRLQEVSAISRTLKAIAKELNIPIVALSQLSRAVETRDDKRPHLSDLRESGTIEQDADVVMFLYREAYYLEREQFGGAIEEIGKLEEMRNVAEIIIAKNRNGPVGVQQVYFNNESTKFSNRPFRK